MTNKITLLQLDEVLPMVEYGIWLRVGSEANYISHNDIWNLLLDKYGSYIVNDLNVDGPLNDGGSPHIVVSIISPEDSKEIDKKLEEAGW